MMAGFKNHKTAVRYYEEAVIGTQAEIHTLERVLARSKKYLHNMKEKLYHNRRLS
jgi:hypothetical protein